VISGPSGAGKGTLIERILPRFPELERAVSATTRERRPGELEGVDYHFLSPRAFEEAVRAGEFLEHVEYAGNRYGTLRSEVESRLERGRSVVVEIELEGARAIRRMVPEAVTIFIAPPSMGELARRLVTRATDSECEIQARLEVGEREIQAMGEFDHRVVNEDVEAASEELAGVIALEIGVPARTEAARG
jgi:guanylate kinase